MKLSVRQIAELLNVSRQAVQGWERSGLRPVVCGRRGKGGAALYEAQDVINFLRQTGAGCTLRGAHVPVNLPGAIARLEAALAREQAPPAADPAGGVGGANVCIQPDTARRLARAIATARVAWFTDLAEWDLDMRASDLAEALDLFIAALAREFQAAGFGDVEKVLDAAKSEAAWPETPGQCLARARAEVP